MTTSAAKLHLTFEEFLELEQKSEEKHDFMDGRVFCMAGGTYHHSVIISNLVRELGMLLRAGPCRALESNMRVSVRNQSKSVYPDVPIICAPPEFDPRDRSTGTILNPKVLIEVLSDSTEAYDRGGKFEFYRDIPSLEEYVLVSQHVPHIESFLRQGEGSWSIASTRGLENDFQLRAIPIILPMRSIYDGVTFTPREDPHDKAARERAERNLQPPID